MPAALPNLFILGAPKCGTTALAQWLSLHPAICSPQKKEPHHFSSNYCLTPSREAYLALYSHRTGGQPWAFDASVWSLFSPDAVGNILAAAPEARFIAMVRRPTELVPSTHAQQLFNGNELEPDLGRALALSDARQAGDTTRVMRGYPPEHLAYLHSCALGWQVERLLAKVPRDRVHVIVYDDLSADPAGMLRQVYRFLELDPVMPPAFERVNTAKARRFPGLDRLVKQLGDLKHRLGIKARFGLLAWLRRKNRKPEGPAPLAEATRQLILDRLDSDTALLERILGRELPGWRSHMDGADG